MIVLGWLTGNGGTIMIHPLLNTQQLTNIKLRERYHMLENELETLNPEQVMEIISTLDPKISFHYPKAIQIAKKIAPLFSHQSGEQNSSYFTEPKDCIFIGESVTRTIPTATEDEIKQELFQQMFGNVEGNLDELFEELSRATELDMFLACGFDGDGKVKSNSSVTTFKYDLKGPEYYSLLEKVNLVISNYLSKEWTFGCQYPQIYHVPCEKKQFPIPVILTNAPGLQNLDISLFVSTSQSTNNIGYDVCNSNFTSQCLDFKISWKLASKNPCTVYTDLHGETSLVTSHTSSYFQKKIMVNLTTILSFFDGMIVPHFRIIPSHFKKFFEGERNIQVAFNATNRKTLILLISQLDNLIKHGYQMIGNKVIITDKVSMAEQISDIFINNDWNNLLDFTDIFKCVINENNGISQVFCFMSVIHHLVKLSFSFADLSEDDHGAIMNSCFFKWVNAHLYTVIALGMNDTLLDLIHLKYPFQTCLIDFDPSQENPTRFHFSSKSIEVKNHNDTFETLIDYQLLRIILTIYPSSINFLLSPNVGRWQDFQKSDSLVITIIDHYPEIQEHINPSQISARVLQKYLDCKNPEIKESLSIFTTYVTKCVLENLVVILRYMEKKFKSEFAIILAYTAKKNLRSNNTKITDMPCMLFLLAEIMKLPDEFNSTYLNKVWMISTPYVREWILEKLPTEKVKLLSTSETKLPPVSSFLPPSTVKSARK